MFILIILMVVILWHHPSDYISTITERYGVFPFPSNLAFKLSGYCVNTAVN